MSIYLYGITEASAVGGREWPPGIADARVEAVIAGALAALVSEIDRLPAPVRRDDLQQHNAVNCAILETGVCVPLRYGTMAPSREVCAAFIADHADRWNGAVERLRNRVELSLKLVIPISDAKSTDVPGAGAAGPGASYLQRRRLAWLQQQATDERRDALEREVRAALSPFTEEIIVTQRGRLLGAAALIKREHFGEAARKITAGLAHTPARWSLSDPWPPYSFVDDLPDISLRATELTELAVGVAAARSRR